MVLVLSEASDQSQYVLNHVGSASRNGKGILVMRVRGTMPSPALQQFIGSSDWIDAWDPPDEQFDLLSEQIESVFSGDTLKDPSSLPAEDALPSERILSSPR